MASVVFIAYPVKGDDGAVIGSVQRDDVNPAWWIAHRPDGSRVDGIDCRTKYAAVAALRIYARGNLL